MKPYKKLREHANMMMVLPVRVHDELHKVTDPIPLPPGWLVDDIYRAVDAELNPMDALEAMIHLLKAVSNYKSVRYSRVPEYERAQVVATLHHLEGQYRFIKSQNISV
jgi:hypothetical protein